MRDLRMNLSSLRFRLGLLVMLAASPGILVLLYAIGIQRAEDRESQRVAVNQVAQLAAAQQQRLIDNARGLLDGLSTHPAIRAGDRAGCEAAVTSLAAGLPQLAMVGATTPDGILFCSSLPAPGPVNLADRPYIQRAIATRNFAFGDFQIGRLQGIPALGFALPVFDQHRAIQALVYASFDLRYLQRIVAGITLPAGARITVVDRNGAILSDSPPAGLAFGATIGSSLLASVRSGAEETTDAEGRRVLLAHRTAGMPGHDAAITVVATIPVAAPRSLARQRGAVTTLFAAILLTFVLAMLVSNVAFRRPIGVLQSAVRRIAAGETGVRAALGRRAGEIGDLARDIDSMASSIESLARQNRLILESVGEGIVGVDGAGRVTFSNPAAQRLLGYTADEWSGHEYWPLVGTDGPGAEVPLASTLRDGEVRAVATRFRRRDGTVVPVDALCTPIRGDAVIVGAVVSFRDVSGRLALEEQLRQAQKMDAIGRLAGGIAHDFNNLLTIITGHTELILLADPAHPAAEDARTIGEAADSAARLTRQLLAFSKRQVLQPRVINPNDLVANLERMLRRVIGENIEFRTTLGQGLWSVWADPGQLEQVLMNLAVNARDAMPDGGCLRIETSNVYLDASASQRHAEVSEGPYVMVAVSDTGIGMDATTRERLFEPFFTTKGHGTGLGLSTVHGIVRQSGGYVWVYSEVGQGTTFKVFLPKAADGARTESAQPAEPQVSPGSGTILIAEDSDGVRALMRTVLSQAGFTLLEATNGEEGAKLADRHDGPLDLVVTDAVMPGMGGAALVERVRARRPHTPVLFVSGYTEDAVVRLGLGGAGVDFLEKPFTPRALRERVLAILAGKRGRT